ncbi:DUF4232 domain-containing protein [Streptomyces sp. NBC_00669]|uniref:DUF4232 domain-containing protein n=1 Tax=Streptomyces sp. NBC_00669 TaxID=2976011 RepID=UPI002E331333|nr:DUF4232 domain-containing protein [Streptomyces sp. NBC_00669]
MRTAVVALAVAGTAVVAAGCGTQSGSGASMPAPAGTGDFRVHADTLPPGISGGTGVPSYGVPPTGGPGVTTSAPPAGPCPASGLRVGVEATDAATGLRQTTVTLTNCGAKSLAVSGYPKLRLLDDHGRTVEVRVHHGDDIVDSVTDPGPATTTLRPGRQVIAILAWRNTYTESNDPPALATTLEFTVAGAKQRVPLHVDLGNTGKLDVTAWYVHK